MVLIHYYKGKGSGIIQLIFYYSRVTVINGIQVTVLSGMLKNGKRKVTLAKG